MKTVLVLGAGRSSSSLISCLLDYASTNQWKILVGDVSIDAARDRIGTSTFGSAIDFDIQNESGSAQVIAQADVVVSLLPPHFHPVVAKHCLQLGRHLLTASYVSSEMKHFHDEALKKGLLFLNECGLDPGIDHMSAMQIMDDVRRKGGKIISFESFTGGLIAPETDPGNPWRYKFTWNPRNVVMAGQGTAKYLQGGQLKYIPYQQLFQRFVPVSIPSLGDFEGYANRDSLQYIDTYGLQGIQTMLRGTLRNKGFCSAWNVLVQLGCCDDSFTIEKTGAMTHQDFLSLFLDDQKGLTPEEKLINQFKLDAGILEKFKWSGLLSDEKIGLPAGTPAQLLEHILNKKWKLHPADKDMIVMIHRFVVEQDGRTHNIQSSLVVKGEDSVHTAMAKTVGLPLAIAAGLLLQNKIKTRGVAIPIQPEIYNPVLTELRKFNIELKESFF